MGYQQSCVYFAPVSQSTVKRDYRALAQVVRQSREVAGLTQEELAEKLGKPQSFVSKVENGDRSLDVPELRAIAHATGLTLVEIVTQYEALLNARK
ncbi:MAG: helix-turn-helix transcriptional regulator [Flavobacteriales bacterium]|nr:helix-turn-helix transcriptional regulator [Flavobacteriales bacterium]